MAFPPRSRHLSVSRLQSVCVVTQACLPPKLLSAPFSGWLLGQGVGGSDVGSSSPLDDQELITLFPASAAAALKHLLAAELPVSTCATAAQGDANVTAA